MISFPEIQPESSESDAVKQFTGQRAKKSLGQNFLADNNIARKIVGELSISKDEPVLEIGPGKGALTRLLVKRTSHVIAVEKDKQLCNSLREEFVSVPHFDLINGDFLHYDFNLPNKMIKVVGNIPYNLTSKIVSKLVDFRSNINFAIIMVQEEVAERLAAKPGTKAYGAISIRLQLTAQVKKLFSVPPTCFQPRPNVNSRVIRISFCQRAQLTREKEFVTFVKRAFGMRRKMLRHFVSHYYGQSGVQRLPTEIHARRIETLPPEKIYELFSILDKHA